MIYYCFGFLATIEADQPPPNVRVSSKSFNAIGLIVDRLQRQATHYEVKIYANDSDQSARTTTVHVLTPYHIESSLSPDTEYKIKVNF